MSPRKPSGSAQLLGLLVICVLGLGLTGLFGVWYTHRVAADALDRLESLTSLLDSARQAQVEFKIQVQLWKNVLIRGQKPADFSAYAERFDAEAGKVQANLGRMLDSKILPPALQDEVQSIRAEHKQLLVRYHEALARYVPGDTASIFAVDDAVRGIDQALNARIDALAARLVEQQTLLLDELQAGGERLYARLRVVVLGMGLVTLACAGLLAWQSSVRKN